MTQYPYFKVLSYDDPEQREEWRSICNSFDDIDIFYLPEYVYLFEIKENGKAQCFVYFDDTGIVIYPFLKRKISDITLFNNIKRNIFDISSPYGYTGYLCNNKHIDWPASRRTTLTYTFCTGMIPTCPSGQSLMF